MRITPTEHAKAEWSRLAQDAYKTGRHAHGHRYSGAAAAIPRDGQMSLDVYDDLQRVYRLWLIGGWGAVEVDA